MRALEVKDLCKTYPGFALDKVSFALERGRIMGFVGRNGAGKTTTLKSILGLARPESGEIRIFGTPFAGNEAAIKPRVGYVVSTEGYYRRKKIRTILEVTRSFFPDWSEADCRHYLDVFHLDENKTPGQLSEGMKVKLSLTVALSHRAELLILDEPTSGLDPVSREELLDIFTQLAQKGVSILFSTHITSDLDHCADDLTYIKNGAVLYTGPKAELGCTVEEFMLRHEKEDIHV